MSDYTGTINLAAPVPGTCRVCATLHDREQPHDVNSLYYKNMFRKKHKRFPTIEDAMSHCSDSVKEKIRKSLNDNV